MTPKERAQAATATPHRHCNRFSVVAFLATGSAVGAFLGLLVLHNKAGSVPAMFSSSLGAVAWSGALALAASTALLAVMFGRSRSRSDSSFSRGLLAALALAAIALTTAEVALRTAAKPTTLGWRIGEMPLLPYDWRQVQATNRRWMDRYRADDSIYVEDGSLGWDIGANKTGADGMYQTSAEGVRSAARGSELRAARAHQRVALIGDSFTFGEEVAYHETWGAYLENRLGAQAQVINFGVPSHGLDQTLLKFRSAVRVWNPTVTILGFLNGAPPRSTNTYLFLRPEQQLPFAKPRFVLRNGRLELLNPSVLSAEEIVAARTIFELPLLEEEGRFAREYWLPRATDASHFLRYLFSRFPRYPAADERFSDATTVALGARLIEETVREIHAANSAAILMFLPTQADIEGGSTPYSDGVVAQLRTRDIAVFDPTDCMLSRVARDDLFVSRHGHYTAAGNAALAECLLPLLKTSLTSAGGASP